MSRINRKMVLFDIDGTLVDTGGKGREAFIRGLAQVTGVRDELEYVSFAGNTDRNVLDQVMAARGIRLAEHVIQRIFREIAVGLGGLLEREAAREIAGAGALLARLAEAGVALGLVTGNIRECAYLKLGSVGFDRYFRFGGFGDQHADRARIARSAVAAAQAAGIEVAGGEICLVGDTPFDVAAGRELGIPVLGVATGRFGAESLIESGASFSVADYSDLDSVVEWLLETRK
jgi:phosphoglycolate phosphatase